MLVHVRAQKVLEAVVDLQAWGGHGYPLPHRVTLHILQVLDTLDHLFILAFSAGSLCGTLRQPPSPLRWPLIILIFAVWMKKAKGINRPNASYIDVFKRRRCLTLEMELTIVYRF